MSDEPAGKPEPRFNETEVRQVLEQAARIESGQGGLSAKELQRVAEEAGFSTESVTRAIDDILAARSVTASRRATPAASPRPPSRGVLGKVSHWARTLTSALVGGTVGFLTVIGEANDGTNVATLGAVALGIALFFRAVHHRRDRDMESYQREAAGIWIGFATAWSVGISRLFVANVGGLAWESLLGIGVIWLACAVIGGLIVQTGPEASGDEALPRAGR